MGIDLSGDGLRNEDRDEASWSESDKVCYGCEDMVKYADECVVLRLVYPTTCNKQVVLLDAIEEINGEFTEEPILFCYACWDGYTDELRAHLNDLFISPRKSNGPSPLKCSFCQTALNWGDYCAHATYGELDVSPRTGVTTFKPSKYESTSTAELICLDCLSWINEECDENIWPDLWVAYNGEDRAQETSPQEV